MSRISTPQQQKKLTREYRTRFFSMTMIVAIMAGGSFIFFLMPSYVLLSFYESAYMQSMQHEGEDSVQKVNADLIKKTHQAHTFAQILQAESPDYVEVSDKVFQKANTLIEVESVEVTFADAVFSINLKGVARTRDALLEFETRINTDDNFSQVQIPLDTLIKQSDIPVNISFTYEK